MTATPERALLPSHLAQRQVNIASQVYDYIDRHISKLDKDLAAFNAGGFFQHNSTDTRLLLPSSLRLGCGKRRLISCRDS